MSADQNKKKKRLKKVAQEEHFLLLLRQSSALVAGEQIEADKRETYHYNWPGLKKRPRSRIQSKRAREWH